MVMGSCVNKLLICESFDYESLDESFKWSSEASRPFFLVGLLFFILMLTSCLADIPFLLVSLHFYLALNLTLSLD